MALAYTREFLIDVFVSKYTPLGSKAMDSMRKIANTTYDMYGKDEFRKFSSVTPEAIRKYKENMKK